MSLYTLHFFAVDNKYQLLYHFCKDKPFFVCGKIKEVSMKNMNLPMTFGEKIIEKVKEKMRV